MARPNLGYVRMSRHFVFESNQHWMENCSLTWYFDVDSFCPDKDLDVDSFWSDTILLFLYRKGKKKIVSLFICLQGDSPFLAVENLMM